MLGVAQYETGEAVPSLMLVGMVAIALIQAGLREDIKPLDGKSPMSKTPNLSWQEVAKRLKR